MNFAATAQDSDSEPDLNAWLPKKGQNKKKVNVITYTIGMLRSTSTSREPSNEETTEFLPVHADLLKSQGTTREENLFTPKLQQLMASECKARKEKEDYDFAALMSPIAKATTPLQTTDDVKFTEDEDSTSLEDETQQEMKAQDIDMSTSAAKILFQTPARESMDINDTFNYQEFNPELPPSYPLLESPEPVVAASREITSESRVPDISASTPRKSTVKIGTHTYTINTIKQKKESASPVKEVTASLATKESASLENESASLKSSILKMNEPQECEVREVVLDTGATVGVSTTCDSIVNHESLPGDESHLINGINQDMPIRGIAVGQLGHQALGKVIQVAEEVDTVCSVPSTLDIHPGSFCLTNQAQSVICVPKHNRVRVWDQLLTVVDQCDVLVKAKKNKTSGLYTFKMRGPHLEEQQDSRCFKLQITSADPQIPVPTSKERADVRVPSTTKRNYDASKVKRATEARLLHKTYNHLNDRTLCEALEAGTFNNPLGLTAADVRNAHNIFGPCLACSQAKATFPLHHHASRDPTKLYAVGELLHIDIAQFNEGEKFLLGGVCTLVCVEEVTDKLHVDHLPSKHSEQSLYKAVLDIVAYYKTYGRVVKYIWTDPEGVFIKLGRLLREVGIELTDYPPGMHERVAERMNRHIREAMRATTAELPYSPPAKLYGELVGNIAKGLGTIPNTKTFPLSPDQIITGLKPELPTVMLPFGTPVLATDPNIDARSKTDPRQDFAVVVGYAGNGGWRCYFKNGKVLIRHALHVLKFLPAEFGWPARDVTARTVVSRPRRLPVTMEQDSPRPAHTPSASDFYAQEGTIQNATAQEGTPAPANVDHESVQEGSAALESHSSYPLMSEATAEDLMDFEFQDYAVPASSSTRTESTEATSSEVQESPVPVSSSPVVSDDDEDGESDTDQAAASPAPLPSVRERHPRAVKKEVDYHKMHQHGIHVLDSMTG